MATGTQEHKDLYYLKLRGKSNGQVDPHFKREKPKKGGGTEEVDPVTWVSGRIEDIVNDKYEWEGDIIPTIKIVMRDGDEKYVIDSSYTQLLRSLLNCLANIENPQNLKISLYTSKDGYASVWVENNGEASGYKWPWEELRGMIEVYKDAKGKDQNSYVKVDEFYAKQVDELIGPRYRKAYVANSPFAPNGSSITEEGVSLGEAPEPIRDSNDDDLPF